MPELLPIFPLGTVLFPGETLPLHIFEPRYRQLVHDLLERPEPRRFGVVAIREGHEVGPRSVRALYDVGCTALVTQTRRAPDGRFALVTTGENRFRIVALDDSLVYLQAVTEVLPEERDRAGTANGSVRSVQDAFRRYAAALGQPEVSRLPADETSLSYAVASALAVALPERQRLLELPTATERLSAALEILRREIALIEQLGAAPLASPPIPRSRLN